MWTDFAVSDTHSVVIAVGVASSSCSAALWVWSASRNTASRYAAPHQPHLRITRQNRSGNSAFHSRICWRYEMDGNASANSFGANGQVSALLGASSTALANGRAEPWCVAIRCNSRSSAFSVPTFSATNAAESNS